MNALQASLRFLTARERTSYELRARLARRGFPPVEIEAAIERAISLGYVDDQRAALSKAEALLNRGASRALIERELKTSGVDPKTLADILEPVPPEAELARQSLEKKFGTRAVSPVRAARYLASKGFDLDAIATAVPELEGMG